MLKTKTVETIEYNDLINAIAEVSGIDFFTTHDALCSNNSFIEDKAHTWVISDAHKDIDDSMASDTDADVRTAILSAVDTLFAGKGEVYVLGFF